MTNLTHSFSTYLFHASTCFEQQVLIIRRTNLYQYITWYNTPTRVCYTRWCIDIRWSSWWWALVARNMQRHEINTLKKSGSSWSLTRIKLTSKLLKSEVQTATANYMFLFYENVTSVIVISSALFRITFFFLRILTHYFYCSHSSYVSVFSARDATDKYRWNLHFSIKLCVQ
jgi:hypothetical protein